MLWQRGALGCGEGARGVEYAKGHFFRPTVLADCTHQMRVMTEETFGPLVGLAPFDDIDEVISRANDTPYGLAAYIYARDLAAIHRLSAALDYGNVAINNVDASMMNAPYGGRKQSGVGYEHGREGCWSISISSTSACTTVSGTKPCRRFWALISAPRVVRRC